MTSTIAMIRCPYTADAFGFRAAEAVHPDGVHRCTHLIPAGGDHLGEHSCRCGVSFVVTSPPGSPLPAANPPPTPVGPPDAADAPGAATAGGAHSSGEVVYVPGEHDTPPPVDVLKTPEEWQREIPGVQILDPDGWRGVGGRPWDEPVSRSEYLRRRNRCTVTTTEGRWS